MTKTNNANSAESGVVASMNDAAMIRICDGILSGHREADRLAGDNSPRNERPETRKLISELVASGRADIEALSGMTAATMDGIRAKATVLLAVFDDDLAASLASDLLRTGAALA